jgi:SNF2 family DNA or RNA helicase
VPGETAQPGRKGPVPWEPEQYQLEGAGFLVERAQAGLFLKPGLRKTSIVLAALKVLRKKKLVGKTLVVAPPRVCRSTWPDEVAKWSDFADMRVVVLHGPKKDDLLLQDADLYLVSFESLEWIFGATKHKTKTGKVRVELDFSRIKALGSKARSARGIRSQILSEAREHFDRIYAMTGSPRPRSMMDLFGVMRIIDGGYSLGGFITHYRRAYFDSTGYGGYTYVLKEGAEEKIYERIAPFVFRLDDKKLLRLPKLVTDPVNIDLPPEARKAYDEIEKKFLTEVAGYTVTAMNSGVSSNKCSQIANGGLYLAHEVDEEGRRAKGPREWAKMHDEKTEAVVDILEQLDGEPALVMYDFGHDLERLLAALGKDAPRIGGGVTAKESDRIISRWNRGELPFLLCHPGAMSHGLNMQGGDAHHVVWHSLTWDYELYDQTIRRLLRSGNGSARVFSHLLVAKDTVDEAKAASMREKEKGQDALLDAMSEYTARRRKALGVMRGVGTRR